MVKYTYEDDTVTVDEDAQEDPSTHISDEESVWKYVESTLFDLYLESGEYTCTVSEGDPAYERLEAIYAEIGVNEFEYRSYAMSGQMERMLDVAHWSITVEYEEDYDGEEDED